jgi:hypothetical protein
MQSTTQSSIVHKSTHELISDYFKNVFSDEEENEIKTLEDDLTSLDGARYELHKQMNYNYLYSMFFMILLIMLISLLFTSYFTTSQNSNNMAPNNSNILNSLNG